MELNLHPGNVTPSCSNEVEAEPLAEGRDSQPSAPPPANGNQMPKELDDDDDDEETPRKCHWPACDEDSDTEPSKKRRLLEG